MRYSRWQSTHQRARKVLSGRHVKRASKGWSILVVAYALGIVHNVYIIFVRNYERVVQVVIQSEEAVGNNMLNLKKNAVSIQCTHCVLPNKAKAR